MDLTDIQETSAEGKIDADSAFGNTEESEKPSEPRTPSKLGKPKVLKPVIWLMLTLASVFFVAALNFMPMFYWLPPGLGETQFDAIGLRATILKNVDQGVTYMLCSMGILLLHEFGHYIATRIYRIPSTLPYCIPCPISPVGTFGAVILMDGRQADRRQIFDVGLAGPIAGLILAVPIMWYGVSTLDLTEPAYGPFEIELPILVKWMYAWSHPGVEAPDMVVFSQLTPSFVAGWFGLIVTGLNMVPMGQLDGGHVTYCLFGKTAHWIARILMVLVIAYQVYMESMMFILMIIMIMAMGLEHPPTRDDSVKLGPVRWCIGLVSLIIPFLCLAPTIINVR
ncbi:MAG: hypothetical protein CMJ82_09235 [Planctomycetaceae bacterium]|nr:hypothetical protein [Planctomycetaceae bacterium]